MPCKVLNSLPVRVYRSDWQRLVSLFNKLTGELCHYNKTFNLCDNLYCTTVLIVPWFVSVDRPVK